MKRLRLTVITETISPYRIPVFNALAKRREIDLHVMFLSETDSSTRQWRVYREEIRFSYEVLPSWRKRIGKFNLLLNQDVAGALDRAAPHVIVCGGYNYVASWQAIHWAKRHGVPFYLWCESTTRDRRNEFTLIEAMKKKFLRHCAGFVAPGQAALDYLQRCGAAPEKIHIARNAVDTELFARLGQAARNNAGRLRAELGLPARYFLFVGRLVRQKGVMDLVRAYQRLPWELREKVGLVFTGNGPLRAELETAARTIYPGHVHFAGFIHREQLPSYYSLAECLVLPTHTDPWGLVVNEGMACGLPVICTTVAG